MRENQSESRQGGDEGHDATGTLSPTACAPVAAGYAARASRSSSATLNDQDGGNRPKCSSFSLCVGATFCLLQTRVAVAAGPLRAATHSAQKTAATYGKQDGKEDAFNVIVADISSNIGDERCSYANACDVNF